jgi:protein gp37
MGERTGITWTHHTRNYWMGCTRIGPGCGLDHPEAGPGGGCYAERDSKRYGKAEWGDDQPRYYCGDGASKDVRKWNRKAQEAGERRRVFVNSYSDVLDHRAPQEWRNRIVDDAEACPWLDILLLTKRIGNAPRMLPGQLPPNVWMGMSAVDSKELHRDMDKLQWVNAAVHWISFEPALAPLTEADLAQLQRLDWIIWGGESGSKPRAIDLLTLQLLCRWRRNGEIPALFIKQFGELHARMHGWKSQHGADPAEWPAWARIQEFPGAGASDR